MARIVPTTVCQFIKADPLLSGMINEGPNKQPELGRAHAFELAALHELLEQIPEELMPPDSEAYLDFILRKGALDHALQLWRGGDHHAVISH